MFWLAAASASITLLTVDNWNLAHYGFPVYILTSCALIASLSTFRAEAVTEPGRDEGSERVG